MNFKDAQFIPCHSFQTQALERERCGSLQAGLLVFPQRWSCSEETGEGCTHPTPLSSSQTEDAVPDLIAVTAAASWSNPHHEEGAPDPGGEFMALGTREPIIPFLISPFIFTCFSCSSRGPSVQLAPSPSGMRNKPWRQRFNPSQARKDGMRPQARKCPLARSCCTVVLLWGLLLLTALLPRLQSSFTSDGHSLLEETLVFPTDLLLCSADRSNYLLCFVTFVLQQTDVLIQELGNCLHPDFPETTGK